MPLRTYGEPVGDHRIHIAAPHGSPNQPDVAPGIGRLARDGVLDAAGVIYWSAPRPEPPGPGRAVRAGIRSEAEVRGATEMTTFPSPTTPPERLTPLSDWDSGPMGQARKPLWPVRSTEGSNLSPSAEQASSGVAAVGLYDTGQHAGEAGPPVAALPLASHPRASREAGGVTRGRDDEQVRSVTVLDFDASRSDAPADRQPVVASSSSKGAVGVSGGPSKHRSAPLVHRALEAEASQPWTVAPTRRSTATTGAEGPYSCQPKAAGSAALAGAGSGRRIIWNAKKRPRTVARRGMSSAI
jgi:hypothetical protein